MATIVTRAGKGSPLTHAEVDANFTNLNADLAALANGMVYKGDWDASAGTFPGGGSAQIGWFYYVSVGGTVGGVSFAEGDNIVATADNASTTTYASNWSKHDQTDAVQAVVGLTGSVSKAALLSALNVEDGADVTDTANVTAAGALMDAELTNITAVKALNQGVATTDSPSFAGLTVDTNTLYVDATNNRVGVGTTSPSTTLDVQSTDTFVSEFTSTSASNWAELRLRSAGGVGVNNRGRIIGGYDAGGSGYGGYLAFNTTSTSNVNAERLRIDSSGNVGIGTSSPSVPLHVVNASTPRVYLGSDASKFSGLIYSAGTTYGSVAIRGQGNDTGTVLHVDRDNSQVRFDTSGTERMRVNSSGNLGVGTTSPAYKTVISNGGAEGIEFGPGYTSGKNLWQNYNRSTSAYVSEVHYASDYIYNVGGTERMRIDSSGNVGIGISTVVAPLHVGTEGSQGITAWFGDESSFVNNASYHYSDARVGISGRDSDNTDRGAGIEFTARNTAGTNWLHGYLVHNRDGAFTFGTGGSGSTSASERMRIDSSGNLLVGTTTQYARFNVSSGVEVGSFTNTSGTGNIRFRNSAGSTIGYIQWSGSSTSYVTSSDYRLKDDVQPMTGASDRVLALNPVNFAWKSDGSRVDGFLAHEAQAVVPEAVTGTKDAVDADGNPVYQGIDQSKLVPLLTAALQEALGKIEALEARVAALEGVAQ